MKILIVIHGFPKEFEAGSEVYSYSLAKELKKENEVAVFCRTQKSLEGIECSVFDEIPVYRVQEADRYIFDDFCMEPRIDSQFREVLEELNPDVVHIHHLNHLSLGIVDEIKKKDIPIIFTLHDYWLICHRGQFVKKTPELIEGVVTRCDRANVDNCIGCFSSNYKKVNGQPFTPDERKSQVSFRNEKVKSIIDAVDLFIAPSRFLMDIFIKYGFPVQKLMCSDYGFRTAYFKNYQHQPSKKFRFGYIGTAIPTKGIHVLLDAFTKLEDRDVELKLFAQPNHIFKEYTEKLQFLVEKDDRISFHGRYDNEIIGDILSHVDAIITPSEWYENSPLVIHEAFQANLPVITANVGGMKELVEDGKWGLLFEQGYSEDLASKMKTLIDDKELARRLGANCPGVIDIKEDAASIFTQYCMILKKKNKALVERSIKQRSIHHPGMPIRLTCINSMACNLHCRMCQVHRRPEIAQREHAFENLLPWDDFKKLADEVFPYLVEFLPTTMGDPMLTPYFDRIPPLLRKYGVKLNLTTNGTLLTEKRSKDIIDILKDVKISFDGASKEVFEKIRRGAKYEELIANIAKLVKIRDDYLKLHPSCPKPTITFQITLQRDNIEELPDLITLAKNIGVDRVKGYHVYVFDEGFKDQSLMNHKILANEKIREAIKLGKKLGVKTEFPALFNLKQDESSIFPNPKHIICRRLWEEVWIDHDGGVAPCCVPNRPILGNIRESSFKEVWNDEKYQEFRKGMNSDTLVEFCENCSLLLEFEPDIPITYDESTFMCFQKEVSGNK